MYYNLVVCLCSIYISLFCFFNVGACCAIREVALGQPLFLIRWLLMLGCLLYAVSGGLGKTSFRYLCLLAIKRQCLAIMPVTGGSLGSKV